MMRTLFPVMLGCLGLFMSTVAQAEDKKAEKKKVIVPTEKIELFNRKDLTNWYTWVKDTKYEDPRKIFTVQPNGDLRISGDGYGGLITNDEYANYHLIIEYRWGTETWQNRKDRSRDGGLLLHCQGEDGNLGATKDSPGPWMSSIECQIIEGGVGDILVLPATDSDGTMHKPTATVTISRDRDGEPFWDPNGTKTVFTKGRINWFGRDPDWKDVLNFRGPKDVDSPGQEWTRLECYVTPSELVYVVNGTVVNRASEVAPAFGKILLQTECAEMFVRKLELHPLPKKIP